MNGSPVHMSPPPLPTGHPTLARYNDHDLSPGSPGGFSPTRPDFRRGSEPAVSMTGFATTPLQRARPGKTNMLPAKIIVYLKLEHVLLTRECTNLVSTGSKKIDESFPIKAITKGTQCIGGWHESNLRNYGYVWSSKQCKTLTQNGFHITANIHKCYWCSVNSASCCVLSIENTKIVYCVVTALFQIPKSSTIN